MEKKSLYQTQFYPIYHTINKCIDELDELGTLQLVGEKTARAFADACVQLVMRTWESLPFDAPMTTK